MIFGDKRVKNYLEIKALFENMRKMCSSREDINSQKYYNEVYINMMIKYQMKEIDEIHKWERIFEENNVFCFDNES
jgi:hypothetical protein